MWLQIIPPVYSLLFIGVVKANEPDLLKEHGGHLELTEDWARHLLNSMEWVKRKGTTGKVKPSEKFLQEEKFSYQREISRIILNHDIPLDLVLNLDQTHLSYASPGKYTFCLKGTATVPIKGVDDKRQITATFTVSASGVFLPIQLIYQGKTKRCFPKFKFPKEFHVTYTKNHWSNFEKCVELFKKVIFPYLQAKEKERGYPEEQYSLIIMDKFQPLDLTINQKAKKYVSSKFNEWYAERVSKQLMNGKAPGDVKISLKLSDLNPLHAKWIVEMYGYLKQQKESVVKGFEKAGILEAVKMAQEVYARCQNPFDEKR